MTDGAKSLEKALSLFSETLMSQDGMTASQLAEKYQVPRATAYRLLAVFERHGLLYRERGGRLLPGALLLQKFDPDGFRRHLGEVCRLAVGALAKMAGTVSHLGIFEQDMVTYVAKSEPEGEAVFTRENHQLEAYCSGIGKVLLSGLSEEELNAYLSAGPFPALTGNTITDPDALADEIARVRKCGFSIDRGEIEETLHCVAVPITDRHGGIIAGLSVSAYSRDLVEKDLKNRLTDLQQAAREIRKRLY